ncbi:MAG: bifunctional nuclease family protein [Elusimicrobia bacterium]|nr:bifunctional nuclease family protein [Elusimicrobiota bacterium]
MAMREAKIFSLVQVSGQCVVAIEEVEGPRLVPIWIGLFEGSAIAAEITGHKFPRPMTHDLLADVLTAVGAKVDRIVINDLRDNTYYATIKIAQDHQMYDVDSRPSDALALAVRVHCPIYIEDQVFERCPEILKPITKEEADKLKQELQNMKPEDFFRDLKKRKSGESDSEEKKEE